MDKPKFTSRNSLFFLIFMTGSLVLALSGHQAWQASSHANAKASQLAQQLEAEKRIETLGKEALEILSLGYYEGHQQWLEHVKKQQTAIQKAQLFADIASLTFAVCVFIWGVLVFYLSDKTALGYTLLWSSAFALIVGLFSPLISIVAYKDLPLLGVTVIKWESKAIVDTISSMYAEGNWFPALLILLFSVVIPSVKLFVLLIHYKESWQHITVHGVRFVQHLGKWSMADVFVVAILVTYLGSAKSDTMQASLQTGLYFFAAYVLLSMIGGILISASKD